MLKFEELFRVLLDDYIYCVFKTWVEFTFDMLFAFDKFETTKGTDYIESLENKEVASSIPTDKSINGKLIIIEFISNLNF